jgi:stalled ribosome rescue protein Dom34
MTVLNIELLDPRAKSLLEELAKLNLIRIQDESNLTLSSIAERIRRRVGQDMLTEEEITAEVEQVRIEQFKKNAS